jgi:hypothetical protein
MVGTPLNDFTRRMHDGVAGLHVQLAGHFGRRAHALDFDDLALGTLRLVAVGHQPQEAELRLGLVMGGHEGALALAAHHQVFGRQFVDGLAHRALADLEAAASSTSLGISSPGFHSPASRLCMISALICWYNGLKVGAGLATPAPRLARQRCSN